MFSGKNSPRARAMRTLVAGLAGLAGTAATLDFFADWRMSTLQLALGLVAVLLGSAGAYFQALSRWRARTAIGKAVATFAQLFAPGLLAVTITELTTEALRSAGASVARAATTALFAAAASYFTNQAEDA